MHIDVETLEKIDVNFKSKLIEWVQKEKREINFNLKGEIGEGYDKMYLVEVIIDEETYCSAKDFFR